MNSVNKMPGRMPAGELKKILMTFKRTFIALAGFSFVINMLMLVPSIYMLQIYDRVLTSRNKETLLVITLITLFMFIVLAAMEWVRSQIMITAGNRMDEMLSGRAFGVAFENALRSGAGSASQVFQDVTAIRQFLTGHGMFAFMDAPWSPIYLIVIYMLHPSIGILATVAAIFLILLTVATEYLSKKPIEEANTNFRKATMFATTNFRNAEVIESMGMLGNVRKHWLPKHLAFLKLQSVASDRASGISAMTRFIRISAQSMVYAVGAYYVINMDMTAGAMIAGSILMGRALAPVEMITSSWKGFVSARSAYRKLGELFDAFPEESEKMKLPRPQGKVAARGIFATPPAVNMQILKNISFDAEEGDMVAVLGPSASGKSSLARVLVGIWKPVSGEMRLGGADVAKWDKSEMGQYIGYLPQDIELLEGTVAENIARFGDLDSEKIVAAAQLSGVHEMILGLPEGYETYIGEGGVVLSGGQRQRIALARAVYGDPVLVVLDEPNSNLDEPGEQALVETLKRLKQQKKTVFVITHRTSTLSVVDKIMIMNSGTIQIYNTKEEVMQTIQKGMQNKMAARPAQAEVRA
ncbi:type I secretion system permease/ATPase [Seleniivibrio woodruffii]|uniref:ATP-binding cassette subfamily C exporter for protease/lipase/ATP-binding cassette subfamily C protein EexD n=1 Tax=Seleniivibrio woodruffii TaxID=1078050 RepID=A0A4R1KE25_9BACT|nr:type I secretion system permease/ATPase [Seleniivibrio woodruffii]TCK62243.1 ATP-binding cassette subfamily C exporter for protease/lipase/ATP-binding cassette subfamily C protein EexD [Seleniivibrio woodruffii]TVZ34639.1 ATP-binding cassette subfamily C exporter for protease/lipase/ATP-binding cassette subfamily C protein EexD [Seleniivibrio woodruffii]